jgi:hypothetical protein
MGKTTILAIGRNEETEQIITEVMHSHADWEVVAASTDEESVEKFHRYHVSIVLFTKGIRDEDERKLMKIFMHQQPDIIVIRQDDRNEVLLHDEIREALHKRSRENRPTISFVDDALIIGHCRKTDNESIK